MRIVRLTLILCTALLLFSIGTVSAQTCYYASNSNCLSNGHYVTLKLSGETNAHGELASGSAYSNVVCCDFGGGDSSCSSIIDPVTGQPENMFLGLSSSTNAHAEAPDLVSPSYSTDSCYAGFDDARETTGNCADEEAEVVQISNTTNAHLESNSQTNYNSKICAVVVYSPADCDLTSASWDQNQVAEGSVVDFTIEGSSFCSLGGAEISIEVFRGGTSCNDISECSNPSNINFVSGTNVTGTWTAGPSSETNYTFVATVVADSTETVNSDDELQVLEEEPAYCSSVITCADYTQEQCEPNLCNVAEAGIPEGIDCGADDVNCVCDWDTTNNICNSAWESVSGNPPESVGKCSYSQAISSQCEEDPVGFISLSWTGTWTWDASCDSACQTANADLQTECVTPGSKVIECPAQIPLPFFGLYTFLITILMIGVIYTIINLNHKKRKRR